MRLAEFICEASDEIVSEWETFARTLTPAATHMTPLALRNHIHEILAFIVHDIESPQTDNEQTQKSRGAGAKQRNLIPSPAETHAALRLAGGFDIDQMVSEYRALRASVVKLWGIASPKLEATDLVDLTRFNESIDQILAESVSHYTQKVNHSKDLLLGILSHDLRTPLNVISMSAELLLNVGVVNEKQTLSERQAMLAAQILESSLRITQIIGDLLDVTHARFGSGLPINRTPMDMGFTARQLVAEMRIAYPARSITLDVSGTLKGVWDKARIGQVFSNVVGNAVQYGFEGTPIAITVTDGEDEVVLSIHNEGLPIPPEKMTTIFDSLSRAVSEEDMQRNGINLGLGLYITKDIVVSHGGSINVTSSEEEGTTFTIRLPKAVPATVSSVTGAAA